MENESFNQDIWYTPSDDTFALMKERYTACV